ncbi:MULTISPECIES: MFS transporter [unclassified Rhizobium]|uniref:MFS transporter n=1 Tax=unclassified Rhizobium TaxID=2613769 RepID=UPI000CDF358A|nr:MULTISPECIES: MFS transporter [Rhizobium]AVA22514.1 major facilitator superfamily protein [Rhizobium sp. NXC24]MDK4738474.1 MFS transporter [Rhizobium sp. CNPSo 3464]UWU19902.1 MFS transporter [Rhizobium tropici]
MIYSKPRSGAGLALLLLCAANFLDAMDVSTIGVALPAIQTELGIPATSLQWAVSAYVLGYGGFLLLGGRVADLFGHRRVFLWSLGVFAAASIAGGFVDSAPTLIAARLVKGIAAAFTAPAALALLLSVFGEGSARAKALGVFSSTGAAGFVLGMVLGGAATIISWRATLVMGAPVAILALMLAPFVLPTDHRRTGPRPHFDWAGALTITPGLLLFVFGITNAAAAGWQAFPTWGALVAAVVLILLFLLVEARHRDPMVPLAIFRRAKLSHANAIAALFQGSYVGFQFIATLYYQDVVGWSAFATGFSFAFGGVCVMFLAPRFAAIGQNRGTTGLMTLGVGLQAISYVFWVLSVGNINPILLVAVSQLLLGVGYAMTYPSVQVAALSDVEDDKSGLASGLLFASFQIGGGIVLAAASATFGAAPSFGWNPYIAGTAFVAILAATVTLLAAVGPRTSTSRSNVYQAAE